MQEQKLILSTHEKDETPKPSAILQNGFLRFGKSVIVDPLDVVAVFAHPAMLGTACIQLRNSPSVVGIQGMDLADVQEAVMDARDKVHRELRRIAQYERAAAISAAGRIPAGVET